MWAALLIGATVLLAVWAARPGSGACARIDPRDWLVLPDEPPSPALALPEVAPVRSTLPVLAVVFPSWTASNEGWRAEKPLQPWFRSPAPCAVACVMGAVSLDLTALGLGVPEIMPTHLPHHDRSGEHGSSDAIRFPFDHASDALFETGAGIDLAAWDRSDFIAPSWARPYEASHDWWA